MAALPRRLRRTSPAPQTLPHPQSTIVHPTAWPAALSEQVTAIQKRLPATGPDPSALASHFGKRTKARIQQISEILETLQALGKM